MTNYWKQHSNTKLVDLQDLIAEHSKLETFCVLPWIHFATRPNGDMRLCCSANASGANKDHTVGLVRKENGEVSNFAVDTPLEAWNSEYMKSVRTTMMSGNIPASCTKCFDEESKGVVSKRVWESATWITDGIDVPELIKQTQEDGTVPEKLVYLDLRLGHTCNLKCIMCSPHDSSKWVEDHKKVFPLFVHKELKSQMNWDQQSFNNKWYEQPTFWNEIYDQIPNLKQVYFAGGEPLMIKEHKKFLEEIISRGYANNILIRYNTNGLLISDDIIELWKNFKKVKVAVSIDDIEKRNHFIRYPADWDTIAKNLHKLDNTPDNIQVSIATAIQILNIKTLPELAKWKLTEKFKKVNFENVYGGIMAGGGIINMHLLYIPSFLSIKVLPEKDKQEVRMIFEEFKSWLWDNYRQDDDFWKDNPYGWKRWQAVLDFMDSDDHTHLLPAFKEYIEKMDTVRQTEFLNIFPHLAHLIK